MIVESISATVILAVAVFFLRSSSLTMPESTQSMLMVGLVVSFLTFAAFVFKENSADERENVHVLTAGRISYLVGVATLILGIIVQAGRGSIDPWLIYALCAMVFSKLLSRIYSRYRM